MSIVADGVSPWSCDTNVRPVSLSVTRIGSPPIILGSVSETSGVCAHVAVAGDVLSLKPTRKA